MKRKCLFCFLCFLLALLIPLTSYGSIEEMIDEAADRGYLCEITNELTLKVTRYIGSETEIVIPGDLFRPITVIGDSAFSHTGITSIEFPLTRCAVEDHAFENCTALTDVIGINTDISDYAFRGCSSLQHVLMGNKVERIGKYAFSGCSSLESIEFPASVQLIQSGAFSGCEKLQQVLIPNPSAVVEPGAFPETAVLSGPGSSEQTASNTVFRDAGLVGSWLYNPLREIEFSDNPDQYELLDSLAYEGVQIRLDLDASGTGTALFEIQNNPTESEVEWRTESDILVLNDSQYLYTLDNDCLTLQIGSDSYPFRKIPVSEASENADIADPAPADETIIPAPEISADDPGNLPEEIPADEAAENLAWIRSDHTVIVPQTKAEMTEAFQTILTINAELENALTAAGIEDRTDQSALSVVQAYLRQDDRVLLYVPQPEGIFYLTRAGLVCLYSTSPMDPETCGTMTAEEAVKRFSEGIAIPEDTVIPETPVMTNNKIHLITLDDQDGTMNLICRVSAMIHGLFADRTEGSLSGWQGLDFEKTFDEGRADCGFFQLAAHGCKVQPNGRLFIEVKDMGDQIDQEVVSQFFSLVVEDTIISLAPNSQFNYWNSVLDAIDADGKIAAYILDSDGVVKEAKDFILTNTRDFYCPVKVFAKNFWEGVQKSGVYLVYNTEKRTKLRASVELLENCWDGTWFDNTVVFLDICHAAEDPAFIDFFLEHGAAAVICEYGSDWKVTEQMKTLYYLTDNLADGMTIGSAIEELRTNDLLRDTVISRFSDLAKDEIIKGYGQAYRKRYSADTQITDKMRETEYYRDMNTYWDGSDSSESNTGVFRQYPFPNPHILYGLGTLYGKVLLTPNDLYPVSEGEIFLYRWINHHFELFEKMTLQDGTYSVAGVPYGIYAIKAVSENLEGWLPVCLQEKSQEENIILKNKKIQSIAIHDDCYQGGSDSVLRVYAIDPDHHLFLDNHANPAFFTIRTCLEWVSIQQAMEESEDPSIRIWRLNGQTLFCEFASINNPSPYLPVPKDTIRYTVWQLGADGAFHAVREACTDGRSGMIDYFENGELKASYPYSEGNLDALQEAFSAEKAVFSGWKTIDRTYYSDDVPVTHYARVSFPDAVLLFDSGRLNEYSRLIFDSKQIILDRWYHPEDVRPEAVQTAETESEASSFYNPVDIYIAELRGQLPGLKLTATDRNMTAASVWSETYQANDGCSVQVTVDKASNRIIHVLFDDSAEYQLFTKYDLFDPMIFRFSPQMQALVDVTASSGAISLTQETRDALFDKDFAVQGAFTTDNEFRRILEYSGDLGEVQVQVRKMLNFVPNEYVQSQLTLTFP